MIRSSIKNDSKNNNNMQNVSFPQLPLLPAVLLSIPFQPDPLNYLRRAGIQWERRVRKSLNAMCTELKAPLQGQIRMPTEKEELLAKWDELSNYQIDLSNYRPVYAPKDLLEVLLSLKGPVSQKQDNDE